MYVHSVVDVAALHRSLTAMLIVKVTLRHRSRDHSTLVSYRWSVEPSSSLVRYSDYQLQLQLQMWICIVRIFFIKKCTCESAYFRQVIFYRIVI